MLHALQSIPVPALHASSSWCQIVEVTRGMTLKDRVGASNMYHMNGRDSLFAFQGQTAEIRMTATVIIDTWTRAGFLLKKEPRNPVAAVAPLLLSVTLVDQAILISCVPICWPRLRQSRQLQRRQLQRRSLRPRR